MSRSNDQTVPHPTAPRFGILEKSLAALLLAMLGGFYWLRSQHRLDYYRFVREDGIAESCQALLLLATALVLALTAQQLLKARNRWVGAAYVCAALGVFLVFAEEISWGQRIVGWESTGYFAAENFQKETNLHNDAKLRFFLDPAVLAVSTIGMLAAFLHLSFVRRNAHGLSFFATELATIGFFGTCAGVYTVYLYLNPIIRPHYNGFDVFMWRDLEMAETFFAVGVFATSLLKLRSARRLARPLSVATTETVPAPAAPVSALQT